MSDIIERRFVLNSTGARKETLDGREYLVVPMVMMTPGVRTANAGSILYQDAEISKNAEAWNHYPIVVYHPEKNGKPASARTPEMVEKRRVGYVFNATYDGKLKGEAWIDIEKADKVDPRIVEKINAGETLEVSTGLLLDQVAQNGVHDGENYTSIAQNIRPDHLALLPDKKGACSIDKGCGCGQNMVNNQELKPLVANEASYSRITSGIYKAMENKFGYVYINDVYDGFFIYSKGYDSQTLLKRSYTVDSEGVVTVADGDPEEVKWVMEYRTLKGAFVGNCYKEPKVADNRETLVNKILACNVGYEKADLEGAPEAFLVKTLKVAEAKAATTPVQNAAAVIPAVPVQAKPMTTQEWLVANNAPPELHQLVNSSIAAKNKLVANILANPKNEFPAEYLQAQPIEALTVMEKLLATPAPAPAPQVQNTYGGAWPHTGAYAGAAVPTPNQVQNSAPKQRPLAPVNVFERAAAK